jgi:hypothetical protein
MRGSWSFRGVVRAMSRSELLRLSLEVPRAEVVTWGIQTFGGIALSPMPQQRHQSGHAVHSQRRYHRVQTIAAMFYGIAGGRTR